jgi:hypothetical protein
VATDELSLARASLLKGDGMPGRRLGSAPRGLIEVLRRLRWGRRSAGLYRPPEITPPFEAQAPPPDAIGCVDVMTSEQISGWARDPASDAPVRIEVEINGAVVAVVTADLFRQDLANAHIDDGRRAFRFSPRAFLAPGRNEVRLLVDGEPAELLGARFHVFLADRGDKAEARVLRPSLLWDGVADPSWFRAERIVGDRAPRFVHALGLFNTGTNYLIRTLDANGTPHAIAMPGAAERQLVSTLCKHYPPKILKITSALAPAELADNVLVIAMVRNPYQWILSMFDNPYEAEFTSVRGVARISLQAGNNGESYASHLARIPGAIDAEREFQFANLVDLWNAYGRGYLKEMASIFPNYAVLRYEDLVTDPLECVNLIDMLMNRGHRESVSVFVDAAKPHVKSLDYPAAKAKALAGPDYRRFSRRDLAFIRRRLSPELMEAFGYESPRPGHAVGF